VTVDKRKVVTDTVYNGIVIPGVKITRGTNLRMR
jgi:hypothetical protein